MTVRRDPIGDRPAPNQAPGPTETIDTPLVPLEEVELLTAFVATVARYLDSDQVSVACGDHTWRRLDLRVDFDQPFEVLADGVREALATAPTKGALPTYGVVVGRPPSEPGPGPALFVLDGATGRATVPALTYRPEQVHRFVDHLSRLAAARGSGDALGRLPLVSDAERDLLAPADVAPAPRRTLVDLIHDRVLADPHATAVVAGEQSLTYAELWARSTSVAAALPGGLVGVWADRTVDQMVGLLGVLRSGGAYVALEPTYPAARLRQVADLASLGHVIAGEQLSEQDELAVAALGLPVVRSPRTGEDAVESQRPGADDLAYVMFTSGSTGVPKGVMIEHGNVVNTLAHMATDPGLSPGEVMLGVTTPAFDLSVPDLFLPLVTGATLVLADAEAHRDAAALARLIERHRPQLMQATPSTWRLLLGSGWPGAPSMRVVCGGEAYDAALVRALEQRVAGVWNFYGPTETCVWSVSCRLTGFEADPLPLGAPMRGVAVYLLDSRQQPCPPGVRGEIAIAGAGLARGYLGNPELTATAFVPCPFPGAPSERMYLTGDLGRLSEDGSLSFAGRRDHQVKLHGFRVELGEIEAVVGALPEVDQAVAVIHEDGDLKRIVCYVVGAPGSPRPDAESVRSHAAGLLPAQSVPAVVVVLDAVPLTTNGKVDRGALPTPPPADGAPLSGAIEELVAEVCSEVLGVPVEHADADVFALGADSLLVGRIAIRLTDELGSDVAPGLVFRNGTVRELARAVLALLVEDAQDLLAGVESGAREALT